MDRHLRLHFHHVGRLQEQDLEDEIEHHPKALMKAKSQCCHSSPRFLDLGTPVRH